MDKKEKIRMLKFVFFSISAGLIEAVSFALLTEFTPLPYMPRYLIALILSVVWNFTFNRRFTFQSANNVPKAMLLVALFYCVFTPATTVLGNFLTGTLGWNDYIATGINMVLNFVTEYLYDRYVVFRDSLDTNDIAKKKQEEEQ